MQKEKFIQARSHLAQWLKPASRERAPFTISHCFPSRFWINISAVSGKKSYSRITYLFFHHQFEDRKSIFT